MIVHAPGDQWQFRLLKPGRGVLAAPIGPAEVASALVEVMLARENLLEDADYQKIVPNQFVVEVATENFARKFEPLAATLCQQWRERLLTELATANSRQGRREYRFAGQVVVEIYSAPDLEPGQVRLRSRLQPDAADASAPSLLPACLELVPNGQTWRLRTGVMTLGREPTCDIFLDLPRVQELRLVSGQHAYLHCRPGVYRLFDGTPQGLPSVNGTYINGLPVSPAGQLLQDGDLLILAAVRPQTPMLDSPGVVGLRFRANCE
jgi:hypothetical protein